MTAPFEKGFASALKNSNRLSAAGFTLVEGVVALALTVLITSIIAVSLAKPRGADTLANAKLAVIAALDRARSETLASRNASQYGVYLTNSAAKVFIGTSYSASATGTESFPLPSGISVTPSLTGGGSTTVFTSLTGETSQGGSVYLYLPGVGTSTITIYQSGFSE